MRLIIIAIRIRMLLSNFNINKAINLELSFFEDIMTKILLTVLTGMIWASSANADDEYRHFPSIAAPNTVTALANLAKYNQSLQAITSQSSISPEDMVKIHELTYTLENAVHRLQQDLNEIADELEKVHKASEVLDSKVIKDAGSKYLKATGLLTNSDCP